MRSPSIRRLLCGALALAALGGCAGSRNTLKVGKTDGGEVVEAEGLAPNNPKDALGTKRASLADAQRNAVEKVVGVFVSARTLVEKAVAIESNILSKTEGYVRRYDILKEGPDGEFYKTKIRALVAFKDLERDLKDMSLLSKPELQRPRVSISIAEEIDKDPSDDDTASTALEKNLRSQGFVVLPADQAKAAEVVIKGKAMAFPFESTGLGGFVSYRARLSAQATRPGSNDVIASITKEASGLGGNKDLAALKAMETVGDLVGSELATQLPDALAGGQSVTVYVEGVTSFSDVDRVKKHLASQPGVSDLVLRSYEEQMAQFEVQLANLQPAELASGLERSSTVHLKVLEAKPQLMRLKLE